MPLVTQVFGVSARVAGGRTRAALEREKALVLRSIKELEFDFAMGKVSQADFDEMGGRLRRRAMGLIVQLDASTGYREQIEREIAAQVTTPAPAQEQLDPHRDLPGLRHPQRFRRALLQTMRHIAQVVTRAALGVVDRVPRRHARRCRRRWPCPTPRQMSGVPLPAPELTAGSLSVRVVRERMGNNIAGQSVSVTSNGTTKTATTDAQGRAEFSGFTPARPLSPRPKWTGDPGLAGVSAPARGGVRVALVAGATAAAAKERQAAEAAAKEPARQGIVVIGGESRLVFEFQSDVLTGFYILEIVNNARTPIDPGRAARHPADAGCARC